MQKGDFGVGWDMALGTGVKIQTTRVLGAGWWSKNINPGGWPHWILENDHPAKVFVTYPDGKQDRFEMHAAFDNQQNPDLAHYWFEPLGDTTSDLYVLGTNEAYYNTGKLVDPFGDPTQPIDKDWYVLVTAEEIEYTISRQQGLKSIIDLNDNSITFTPRYSARYSAPGIRP